VSTFFSDVHKSMLQKEEPEFDIAKLVWERKDAMAAQKQAEEVQKKEKCRP